MSGHTPTVLELTSSPRTAVASILATLRGRHRGRLRLVGPEAQPRRAGGPILLGGAEVVIGIDFAEDPSDSQRVCPIVELGSEAYSLVYPKLGGRLSRGGQQALVDFCHSMAVAAGAEGFRLRFGGPAAPMTSASLVEAITSGQPGLVVGVAAASEAWPKVKGWFPWTAMGAHQVAVLL